MAWLLDFAALARSPRRRPATEVLLASSGLEYCGKSGRFPYNHCHISDGPVYRSLRLNREGELGMLSIILDARRR